MSLLPTMTWLNITFSPQRVIAASSVLLEEDKGPDHDVFAAWSGEGHVRVDTGGMERPARNGAVGHRVIAFEHRDFGALLLREPVPLVARTIGEAGGLADPV